MRSDWNCFSKPSKSYESTGWLISFKINAIFVLRDVSFSQYSDKSVRLKNDINDKSNNEIKGVIQIKTMWLFKLILFSFK